MTSLQHDGVIMIIPENVRASDVATALGTECTRSLGYDQPVEEKEMDPGDLAGYMSGSESD